MRRKTGRILFVCVGVMAVALVGCRDGSGGSSDIVAPGPDIQADTSDTPDQTVGTDDTWEEDTFAPAPLPFAPAGPHEVPDPMAPGPFPTGVRTFDLFDESRPCDRRGTGRWLRVDIWYPATQDARDGEEAVIDVVVESEGIITGAKRDVIVEADIPLIPTGAYRDAPLETTHGPYPVVLFSHGANGIRWQSVFYTVHLASHGYIVISADHDYNTLWDVLLDGFQGDSLAESLLYRPDDMMFLLDTLEAWRDDPDSFLHAAVNVARVAASGHSLGGVTSTAVACLDPRLDAVVLHSPQIMAGQLFGRCLNEPFPVPSMTMGGTMDDTLQYCGQYCDYKHQIHGEQPKYLFELLDGGHFTFSDVCLLDLVHVARELEMGSDAEHILTDGCGELNVPFDIAHAAINHYATAFLNLHLRDSEGSRALLVESDRSPFHVVNFFEGDVPDFWGEGGCDECSIF